MAEMTDSGGRNWRVTDTLGMPWLELPEALRSDLLTWRHLRGIAETIKWKRDHPQRGEDN